MEEQTLHHFMEDLLPRVVITTMVIAAVWILSLLIASFRQRAYLRAQTDLHKRMIDKFSSLEEFSAYLRSEAGKSFFENFTNQSSMPFNKILVSKQIGAILTLLGIGIFVVRAMTTDIHVKDAAFATGVVSLMIGLGFLISSFISYRLARACGLIRRAKSDSTAGSPPAVS